MKQLIFLFLLSLPLLADVTPEQQKEYARTVSKLKLATLRLQVAEAEAEVQNSITMMVSSCASRKLVPNANGEPVCAELDVKPKTELEPKKDK